MTGETEIENIKPFGNRLAEARKALGLTLDELSKTLNLDIKILDSLEKSDIDRLPPPIYVQGYIKAYTKALNISSEDIHADFLKSVSDSQDVELQPRSPLPIETTSESPIVKSISIIFAIMAALAIAFMVYSYYAEKVDEAGNGTIEMQLDTDTQEVHLSDMDMYEQTVESVENAFNIPSESVSENRSLSDAESGNLEQNGAEVALDEIESTLSRSESDLKAANTESAESAVIEDQDSLMIRATTESWAEIRDANKVRIYYGMLVPEDLRILKGKAPFDVFLGNALYVNIAVNDIDVDMSDYIRANNVARFKVSEKSNQIVFH